jgi:preprotein translocase subunit SecF
MQIDKIGSRKFITTVTLFITSILLLVFGVGGITFFQWADFMKYLVCFFFVANAGEHFAQKFKKQDP